MCAPRCVRQRLWVQNLLPSHASSPCPGGVKELARASKSQRKARSRMCIIAICVMVVLIILVLVLKLGMHRLR